MGRAMRYVGADEGCFEGWERGRSVFFCPGGGEKGRGGDFRFLFS